MTSDDIATYDEDKKAILEKVLRLFEHSHVNNFEQKGNLINVEYEVDGTQHELSYNTEKGVLEYDR